MRTTSWRFIHRKDKPWWNNAYRWVRRVWHHKQLDGTRRRA